MGEPLRFAKMHGLGNDFMVIDLVTQDFQLTPPLVPPVGGPQDRHRLRSATGRGAADRPGC